MFFFPALLCGSQYFVETEPFLVESLSRALQFGEIDIDSELVAHQDFLEDDQQIMMLNNGCLCCTVKDDLIRMLCELVCALPLACRRAARAALLTLLVSARLLAMQLCWSLPALV